MDSYSRSQSVLQARPGGTALPSRASRILQKMTGRLRFYPSRKTVSTTKDDNDPYPSRTASRLSVGGVKPYMSHPILNNTLVKPYEPGYDQDSPTQSASPSRSVFRGPFDQHKRSENNTAHPAHTTITAMAATASQVADELQLSFGHEQSFVWNNNDHRNPDIRPPRLIRPSPDLPTLNHHRPSMSKSDALGQTVSSSMNSTEQATPACAVLSQNMTSPKESKNETPSTFRLFTRKVSGQNLHDTVTKKKSINNLQNAVSSPSHPSKYHRPSPATVISNAPGDVKRPKPARIDTSSVRLFTRKPSRLQLQESHPERLAEDPPTSHVGRRHGPNLPPRPPPPPPKIFPMLSKIAPPAPFVSSSSTASTSSSYYLNASISTPTDATTNTTPASTTLTKTPASPFAHVPAPITAAASTSALPNPPPPPILQRSETAPHSYRLSVRLSGTSFLRPPPLPVLNLPTLPPPSPSTSSPQRFCLRDVPRLSRDGGRREPDEVEDDLDEDEKGRMSRSSGRVTPFIDHDHEGEDESRRPSLNSSTGDLSITTTSSSFNTSSGGGGKTRSRSSSYNHSTLSQSVSLETTASASFTHGTDFSSSDFLSLPGPDISRLDLDLSFLDRDLSPSPTEVPYQNWKGKARARPEDDVREYREEGGRTPTLGKIGSPSDIAKHVKYALPVRKDSLKLRTGPDMLGGGVAKGKGKAKEWDEEMDTAKPQGPVAIQASISLGGPSVGAGSGVGLHLGRSGTYTSKRASRSLVDLGAAERREKVEEIVRDEEEKKMERRKSQLSRTVGSSGEVTARAPKLRIDTQLAMIQARPKGMEEGERQETVRSGRRSEALNLNGEATPSGLITPKQPLNKRLSKAPPYEAVVRKRRSLPMFTEATGPPPYPVFPPLSPSNLDNITPFGLYNQQAGLSIEPRDDEGREGLPPYSNTLYLRALLSRKMEFSSAGVQARDRKWRRVVCVLEGTALKVYKAPREHTGKGMFGEWWERKVGVADVSMAAGPAVQPQKGDETGTRERIPKLYGEGVDPAGQTELELRPPPTPITPITPERTQPRLTGEHPFIPGESSSVYGNVQAQANRSRLNLAVSSLFKPSSQSRLRSHGRVNGDGALSNVHGNWNSPSLYTFGAAGSSVGYRHGDGGTRPGSPSAHSYVPSSVSSVRSQKSSAAAHAIDDPRDLLRVYTMQNAESGLGNDYIKRKNVIRVRAEGEQFLLQAKDVADVVAWIEILQASANIALDLDERLMPKGPLFPRRRRRRPRQTMTTETGAGATTGASAASVVTNIMASATAQIAVPL